MADDPISSHDLTVAAKLARLEARMELFETMLANHASDEQTRQQEITEQLRAIRDQLVVWRTLRRVVATLAAVAVAAWAFAEWARDHVRWGP